MITSRLLCATFLSALSLCAVGCSAPNTARRGSSTGIPEVLRLHHVVDGELGSAIGKREVVVPLHVSTLEKGQRFACGLRSLQIRPEDAPERLIATLSVPEQSRMCNSPQSGESTSLSCVMPEERLAIVRLQISLTERSVESLRFSLLCAEYPTNDAKVAATPVLPPPAEENRPPAKPSHPLIRHAPPKAAPKERREAEPSQHLPLKKGDMLAQGQISATSRPDSAKPAVAPSPASAAEPALPANGHRLEIENRGRPPSPRLTLTDCDSLPAFQSGAIGTYHSGKRHGGFRVTDKNQCEIQLSSGVSNRDELQELGSSVLLSFQ